MQVLGFASAELVGMVTSPQAECLKNYGLIHSRGKRFFSSLQHPEWAWSTTTLLFIGYWGLLYQPYGGQGMDGKHIFTVPKLLLLGHQVD
jgi:hypothetical protein